MKYISTRGQSPELSFEDVLLTGLAPDGGLYMPVSWPTLTAEQIEGLAGLSYADCAFEVISPFIGDDIEASDLKEMINKAYASFDHEAVTPLSQLSDNEWMLELSHGPTFAFKDVAMQLLGPLFDYALGRRDKRITIIGATSGDTGSAAIEAMRGRDAVDVFILHPHNRTSEVQRRQMTTVLDENVHNIAIEGTFDDCQALVKSLFNDATFRNEVSMAGVNSINWARVMAQIVYYFYAAIRLGAPKQKVSFSVPTGNFGDVFAGYAAACMGLPIEKLIIATNVNDILTRTLEGATYEVTSVTPTYSPSMDIQVSSNFERLLFDACGRDADRIRSLMGSLAQSGQFTIDEAAMTKIRSQFDAARVNEEETLQTIKEVHDATGHVIDPHTAVGVAAAKKVGSGSVPMIILSTADAAKFPAAVEKAIGSAPDMPPRLAAVMDKEERLTVMENEAETLKSFVREHSRVSNPA